MQVIHGPGDHPRTPGKHILGLLSASCVLNPPIPPLLLVDINTWQHFFLNIALLFQINPHKLENSQDS